MPQSPQAPKQWPVTATTVLRASWLTLFALLLVLTAPAIWADSEGEADDAPKEHRNMIRWATASEIDNFGYDVYRGDSEDGPFERINPEPIQGAGTTDDTSRYEYADETIDPTKAYWYYVESISMDNVRERFTPVFRAKPKIGADVEAENSQDDTDG